MAESEPIALRDGTRLPVAGAAAPGRRSVALGSRPRPRYLEARRVATTRGAPRTPSETAAIPWRLRAERSDPFDLEVPMSDLVNPPQLPPVELTAAEREWIRRQGVTARVLAGEQRRT